MTAAASNMANTANTANTPDASSATQPLDAYPVLISQDLDEVRQQGGQVFCAHQLQLSGPAQRLDTRLYYRPLRHIGLGRLSYGATVDIDPGTLEDFYLLQWPVRGGELINVGREQVHSTPQVATLINPGQRFFMRHQAHSEKLFIRIDRHALQRLAEQLAPGTRTLRFETALPLHQPTLASLRHLLDWLFIEASSGLLLAQPLLASRIEETLLLSLLQLLPHNQQGNTATSATHIAPGFIVRAEEFMRSHAHEPLTVARIAQETGVSIRSLYAGFQRYRQRTPMEYWRDLRLQQVHQELQHTQAPTANVTQIALRWGFGHLGQFAADYKKRFGELPSHTLRRGG